MAYPNGLKSPRDEPNFPTYASPIRTSSSQFASHSSSSNAERASLTRRFTTNAVPTLPTLSSFSQLSPIGQQRVKAMEQSSDGNNNSPMQQAQALLRKKKEEHDHLRRSRDLYSTALELELEHSKHEVQMLESELQRLSLPAAQSEPTTPPEYREAQGPPKRANRMSITSINALKAPPASSMVGYHRNNLSGTHHGLGLYPSGDSQTPDASVPGSRRNSDEEEGEEDDTYNFELPKVNHRGAVRNSMPVTNFDYRGVSSLPDVASVLGINNLNSINSLLNDDEDEYPLAPSHRHTASIDNHTILRAETTSEEFPILVRRSGDMSSASGNLANASGHQSNSGASSKSPWSSASYLRHRQGQQSLPLNTLRGEPINTRPISHSRSNSQVLFEMATPTRRNADSRKSVDVTELTSPQTQSNRSSLHISPPHATNTLNSMPPNLRSSFSTNDVPTINNLNLNASASSNGGFSHAEHRLHQHNVSLGRVPQPTHRREHSTSDRRSHADVTTTSSQHSMTQSITQASTLAGHYTASTQPNVNGIPPAFATPVTSPPLIPNNGYPHLSGAPLSSPTAVGAQTSATAPGYVYLPYQVPTNNMTHAMPQAWNAPPGAITVPYYGYYYQPQQQQQPRAPIVRDSQQAVIQSRRNYHYDGKPSENRSTEPNRYANTTLESMKGQIFELSKDQHGCRFLQRKIDEDKRKNLTIIFDEVQPHVVDLMKDSFGNYLCQKLLEFCSEDQRAILIENAAPAMVDVATNQHGTRALQKMIESVVSDEQIQVIIDALKDKVVDLIKDLNGNHVIQKCLNHLPSAKAQFIFDAVGENALTVGTHRHGCCVLQRCIDHATGVQQQRLITQTIGEALKLMKDAYGNYVIQYILDLQNPDFTNPLIRSFKKDAIVLSKQKFSSNVVEKSIRLTEIGTQRELLEEFMVSGAEMEALLRDNYANYVVQTSLEHAPEDYKDRLWAIIAPVLPNIRGSPSARRLASRLALREGRPEANRSGRTSGTTTPRETSKIESASTAQSPMPPMPQYNAVAGNSNLPGQPYRPPHHPMHHQQVNMAYVPYPPPNNNNWI